MTGVIYGAADPLTGELRYVGKTTRPMPVRVQAHLAASRRGVATHFYGWIRALAREGLRPAWFVIESAGDGAALNEAEQFYVCYFRFVGSRLTNATLGGDGGHGLHHTPEARARIGAARRGTRHSAEAKEKQRAAALRRPGRTPSLEELERRRVAATGKKATPETRLLLSRQRRGRMLTADHRAHIAAGMLRFRAKQHSSDSSKTNPNGGTYAE